VLTRSARLLNVYVSFSLSLSMPWPSVGPRSGSVCLDVINQTWSPMFDLINIFEVFLPQLLTYPNPTDPLNGEAAALQMREPERYQQKVREYVLKYARPEDFPVGDTPNAGGDGEEEDSEFDMSDDDDDVGDEKNNGSNYGHGNGNGAGSSSAAAGVGNGDRTNGHVNGQAGAASAAAARDAADIAEQDEISGRLEL
jgi:hypothetical protein